MTQSTYTDRRRPVLLPSSFWRGVLLAVLLAFLAWAAKPLVPVTAQRFEADSVARDRDNSRRDSTLNRIDARVGAIYCGSLPDSLRAGCR